MFIKKRKAFTLAELMVIMSVLTILMAAFAPIVTSRYTNSSVDSVWSTVPEDSMNDIYSDGSNKEFYQTSFIGITPIDGDDIKDTFGYSPAKLVVRSSDNLSQKQLEFRYNDQFAGYLASAYNNILLGADYNLSSSLKNNTAIGRKAFNGASSSENNVVIGYNSLSDSLSSSKESVVIGNNLLEGSSIDQTVAIGHNMKHLGNYSVAISSDLNNTEQSSNSQYKSVAVGGISDAIGNENVAIGYHAMANGDYNVAIGDHSNYNPDFHFNVTSVGYSPCNFPHDSYSTCLGAYGKLFGDSMEHIFIGKPNNTNFGGALEVHNLEGKDASVIINGNLIVRGQPFMRGKSHFSGDGSYSNDLKSVLMGYHLIPSKDDTDSFVFAGDDGSVQSRRLDSTNTSEAYQKHMKLEGHETCICSSLEDDDADSYDWISTYDGDYNFVDYINDNIVYSIIYDSGNSKAEISRSHGNSNGSCCPDLGFNNGYTSSDIRLKNIASEFSEGLNSLNKLKFYNFTFKSDKTKTPQVGVIAQSLKKVFPYSVFKDEKGYYKIRWDEMFYSSINSVKELNEKANNLISRVENDIKRIEKLKKDNEKLRNKLIELSNRLDELEEL